MIQQKVIGVGVPRAPERTSRPALEAALARAPWLLGVGMALVTKLPPTSRLRRRFLQEAFARAFAAVNREDPWFVSTGYEPDCEIYSAVGFRTLGMDECYHGHDGWWGITDAVREEFADMRWVPEHLIDLGDRWVLRLEMSGTGRSSGVHTHQTWGSVYDLSPRGRIARQDIYWTWDETLAAAGLRVG